jgi:hypothetical protein
MSRRGRERWARVASVIGLFTTAMAPSSCRRSNAPPPPAAVVLELGPVDIQVDPTASENSPRIDGAAVADHLRAFLIASGIVVPPGQTDASATGPSVRIGGRVRIAGRIGVELVEVGAKGLCRASVTLGLSTRPSDTPGALSDELSALGEERFDAAPGTNRAQLAQKVVERTATDLLGGVVARVRLNRSNPAELHATIVGDGGVEIRQEAIRLAGVRQLTAEAPTLLALLNGPDEPLRDAALGALILLRDQRAVTVLTRERSFHDRREMLKILEAISRIGGNEARDYLSFVAQSHDDPEIRELARAASERLLRGAAKPAP